MTFKNRIYKVLLIEDDPGDQKLIKMAFANTKYSTEILIANDGEKALDFIFKKNGFGQPDFKPDLILLDLNLPKIDGHKVLESIRAQSFNYLPPVVILTTSSLENDIKKSFFNSVGGYFIKPEDISLLNKIISDICYYWFEAGRIPEGE